jgi:hypothetical protein
MSASVACQMNKNRVFFEADAGRSWRELINPAAKMTTVAKRDQTVVALMSSGASAASIGFAIAGGSYSSYVKLSEEQSVLDTLVHLLLEPEFNGAEPEARKFEWPSLSSHEHQHPTACKRSCFPVAKKINDTTVFNSRLT